MSEHIVSRKIYFGVFAALMVGTFLTVVAAQINFGPLNDVIAMTIAVTKALLVVLFFMHVRYGSRLNMVVVVSGFFWLFIMISITLSDYKSREWMPGRIVEPNEVHSSNPK